MGACPNRLYCSWHVDRSFQESVQRLIRGDRELQIATYKTLRTLMELHDVITFESMLPMFISNLQRQPVTEPFAQYFIRQYAACAKTWAYCYRIGCGVNTNMCLERMHGILKYKYLRGKRTRLLDAAIKGVMDMVSDRQFDRLITLCNGGKMTKKLSDLRRRHTSSLDPAEVTPTSDSECWLVRSENDGVMFYSIRRIVSSCQSCELRCIPCNACLHMFECSCADHAIRYNMCKHIHTVCQFLNANETLQGNETNDSLIIDASQAWKETEADLHASALVTNSATVTSGKDEARTLLVNLPYS